MLKIFSGFMAGLVLVAVLVYNLFGSLMFKETPSPFGLEETVARVQQNIQNAGNGWALVGLREPAKAVQADGGNVLPVILIEACSTQYSGPILKNDDVRFLSLLIPCKVSVYKKNDGKIYIGTMNAGLVGRLFGPAVGDIMSHVSADQAKFLIFDASKPAPAIVRPAAPGASGGAGAAAAGGC